MGPPGGKLNPAKPSLLWKKRTALLSRNYPALLGSSQCILSLWFLSSKQFQLILSLAAAALLLLRTLLTQLSTQIDLTNNEHVSHRWNFPPWRRSGPLRSSTVWAVMDAVMTVMRREKNLTKSKLSLWTFLTVLTCSVPLPSPINGDVVTDAAL